MTAQVGQADGPRLRARQLLNPKQAFDFGFHSAFFPGFPDRGRYR